MTGPEMTTEQANIFIGKEKQERADRFKIKLEKMLDEDKCLLRPYPFLDSEGRIKAGVEVVAL